MLKEISDSEFRGVTALTSPERYSYFVRQVADFEEVWSLRTPEGWVTMGGDAGARYIPVWPHQRYAEVFVTDAWSDAEAASIELEPWMERWLPGMSDDGIQVAVFPVVTEKTQGVVVPPMRLQRDLELALEQYE
jgi:Protein of unknown function (DUF2750)